MSYTTIEFYELLLIIVAVYYILPLKVRWLALLSGSLFFYYQISKAGFYIFIAIVLISYLMGLFIESSSNRGSRTVSGFHLFIAILVSIFPLIAIKNSNFIFHILKLKTISWVVPVGISFYSLQLVAYQVDIFKGKIEAQKNPLKYLLFMSFFPQIIQGPIPRYKQLGDQLFNGNRFDEVKITKGIHLIIWGFFLKFMIADKAGVIVNTVFDNFDMYLGMYILVAGMLYSVQLYTDFMACVTISKGIASLFGIDLMDNFDHPYLACSIKDFWRRWHISLSTWLRDYIYIPLGGNRHGRLGKNFNLIVTFFVSGIWHGASYKFIVWGLLHAVYQITGDLTRNIKEKLYDHLKMPKGEFVRNCVQRTGTFFWVTLGWIVFRAKNLNIATKMLRSIVTVYNPWILFNDALLQLGLTWKEWGILIFSILTLILVSKKQEEMCIRDWILKQHIIVRWFLYILVISVIWIFGTYGYGFSAQEFIYGGF